MQNPLLGGAARSFPRQLLRASDLRADLGSLSAAVLTRYGHRGRRLDASNGILALADVIGLVGGCDLVDDERLVHGLNLGPARWMDSLVSCCLVKSLCEAREHVYLCLGRDHSSSLK